MRRGHGASSQGEIGIELQIPTENPGGGRVSYLGAIRTDANNSGGTTHHIAINGLRQLSIPNTPVRFRGRVNGIGYKTGAWGHRDTWDIGCAGGERVSCK